MKRLAITLFVCLGSTFSVRAQTPIDIFSERPRMSAPSLERRVRMSGRALPPRTRLTWVNEFEPNSTEKGLLSVDLADEERFADLLAQPNTGIARLLPLSSQGRVVSVSQPEAYRRPGFTYFAATYSFSKRKHGNCLNGWHGNPGMGWAELRLKEGILGTAIMEDSVGLMVRLGDVPLETVTVQTAGVADLDILKPPTDSTGAKNMAENSLRGIKVSEFTYSSRIPANLNTTYVLRSTMRKRADVLVAFRIVQSDSDGITILWKKLKEYPKPSWKKRDQK